MKLLIPIEFVFVEAYGWNIHIDVVRCKKHKPDEEVLILSTFENHMTVLQATVKQKVKFQVLVEQSEELEWVDHESQWAGLGAVRYVPLIHRQMLLAMNNGEVPHSEGPSSPPSKEQVQPTSISGDNTAMKDYVNQLNAKIVDKLKTIDSAFSLGKIKI